MAEEKLDLGALQRELEEALADLKSAEDQEQASRRRSADARNRVNAAQKAIDAGVKTLAEASPGDSDWRRRRVVPA